MKGWVDTLAFVDQTIWPNQRDAVLTSRRTVGTGTRHQVEDALAVRSSNRAIPIVGAIERVEGHIQILGRYSVDEHFALDGKKGWLCQRTAHSRQQESCSEREYQPEHQ